MNTETSLDAGLCRAILETLPIGLYIVDRERRILLWNEAAGKISGYRAAEVTGRHCHENILLHCDRYGAVLCGSACPLIETMHDGHPRETEVFLRHKLGHRVPVHVRAVPLRKESGAIVGAVELFEARAAPPEQERRETGQHQETGRHLLDRPFLETLLAGQLYHFEEWRKPSAVLCVRLRNLDHFSEMYGRHAVAEAIGAVARTLAGSVRRTDHVGYWSPGQLMAIMPNCRMSALPEITQRLRELLAQTAVLWWGERLAVEFAIGATGVREGDTAESMLSRCEEELSS